MYAHSSRVNDGAGRPGQAVCVRAANGRPVVGLACKSALEPDQPDWETVAAGLSQQQHRRHSFCSS